MDLPVALLGDLQAHNGLGRRGVGTAQVVVLHVREALRQHRRADVSIALLGPHKCCVLGTADAQAADPAGRRGLVSPGVDGSRECGRPALGLGQGRASRDGLWDLGVPDGVQVGGVAVVRDIDAVAAYIQGLAVKRLADVADKLVSSG